MIKRTQNMITVFVKRLFISVMLVGFFGEAAQCQFSMYASDSVIHLADPTIFPYKGIYYLYGTVEGATNKGFTGYRSTDLQSWSLLKNDSGYVLKNGDAYGNSGFWAPQIFKYNKKFYMAYVANENIAIAQSDSPEGPFKQELKQPLAAPVKQIDPFVFIDDDGKKYLYHVRLVNGNKIFVAELNDDFSAVKEETLKECIDATDKWENTQQASWPVIEGPSVLKHKGVYYLFYSANDFRNPDYAVGYATSTHPLGPWKKYEGNPIISKNLLGENGTGHGDFFMIRKKYYYVFHAHNSNSNAWPRKTAIIKAAFYPSQNGIDKMTVDAKSFRFIMSNE